MSAGASIFLDLPSLRAEVVDLAAMSAEGPDWDALAADAMVPNPFFSRHVVEAHRASGLARNVRLAVVREGNSLAALLPLAGRTRFFGLRRVAGAWLSPYMVSSTPLVRRGASLAVFDALLEALAEEARGGAFVLPLLPPAGPVACRLREAIARRGWNSELLGTFERAVLDRRASYEDYAREHLGKSRRKGLERLRRRLSERGRLEYRAAKGGAALSEAVETFLALEAAGWKGRSGTAMACTPATASLARRLFAEGSGPAEPRADLLALDGRPIAVSLALSCGGVAWLLKTAYDEDERQFAPGLVLEDEIARAMHVENFCDRLDSASLPGGALDEFYADREPYADLVVMTRPGASLAPALRAESLRRAGLERLKALKQRLPR